MTAVRIRAETSSKTPRRYRPTVMAPARRVGIRKRTRTPTTSLRSRFQRGTDGFQDLGVAEGLGDVGRCAEREPLEDLDLLRLGGEHDHGDGPELGVGLDGPADL